MSRVVDEQSELVVRLMLKLVLDVNAKSSIYRWIVSSCPGTTSVVIRKNWNDTEKISMAPAQG